MEYDRRTAKVARYWPIVEDGKAGVPISLQVALCDACFNRCAGCGHPLRPQRQMEVIDWLKFLNSLPHERLESVCYSGGDPMAYQKFNAVMMYHVTRQLPFGMTITGYVPPHMDMGLMSAARWVRVSLDAVTPEVYAKVRGKTPVAKVLQSIERMQAHNVNVALGITISPDNEEELPNVLAWAKEKGITDIDARYAYPQSNPRWPDYDHEARGMKSFKHCHATLYQMYIDSDGSAYPCCITAGDTRDMPQTLALGNIFSEPWDAIWPRVVEYSKRDIENLPAICRTCCVQRLSEINHICDSLPLGKSFF